MSGFTTPIHMYMSIEEAEEGKKEEDTGVVQGTQGPSAYLSNHLFYLLFVSYFVFISYVTERLYCCKLLVILRYIKICDIFVKLYIF